MTAVIKAIALVAAAVSQWPQYAAPMSRVAVLAVQQATPEVSAELLTAIAYYESRGDVTAVSRVQRRNGSTALFCGVTQATAASEADCVALRDVATSLRRTVHELGLWRAFCRRRGNDSQECALAGYAEGVAGAARGTNRDARRKIRSAKSLALFP